MMMMTCEHDYEMKQLIGGLNAVSFQPSGCFSTNVETVRPLPNNLERISTIIANHPKYQTILTHPYSQCPFPAKYIPSWAFCLGMPLPLPVMFQGQMIACILFGQEFNVSYNHPFAVRIYSTDGLLDLVCPIDALHNLHQTRQMQQFGFSQSVIRAIWHSAASLAAKDCDQFHLDDIPKPLPYPLSIIHPDWIDKFDVQHTVSALDSADPRDSEPISVTDLEDLCI